MENIELRTVKLTLQADGMKEILEEATSLLEVVGDGRLPKELRERLLEFLQTPTQLFSVNSKGSTAGGADECRILLKPSDGFLHFLLALRAWNRQLKVSV